MKVKTQNKKKFSKRLSEILFNGSQPSRSKFNTSGTGCSTIVTKGDNIDVGVPPKIALKGKEVRYE